MPRVSRKRNAIRDVLFEMILKGPEGRMDLGRLRRYDRLQTPDLMNKIISELRSRGVDVTRSQVYDVLYKEYGGIQSYAVLMANRVIMESGLSESEKRRIKLEGRGSAKRMEELSNAPLEVFVKKLEEKGFSRPQAERLWKLLKEKEE